MSGLNRAQVLKDKTFTLLKELEDSGCTGTDQYSVDCAYHAMAEALYLQSLNVLFECELVSSSYLYPRVNKSLIRLENALLSQNGLSGWGLGFSHNNRPREEIYTITTAMVVCALAPFAKNNTKALQLLKVGIQFLESPELNKRIGLTNFPLYSLHHREHIVNAWLYAKMSINAYVPISRMARSTIFFILNNCEKQVIGWRYSTSSSKVDLLHQAYIAWSLWNLGGKKTVIRFLVDELDVFRHREGFYDVMEVVNPKGMNKLHYNQRVIKISGEYVVINPKEARPWSLGMLLVLLSDVLSDSRDINCSELLHLEAQFEFLLGIILNLEISDFSVREKGHLLLGLSSSLKRKRKN